ncbi:MAG: hypothetical protein ABI807_07560 [Sporichthyaceae bacterium]
MPLHVVPLGSSASAGLKLKDGAIAVPALASHVRPSLVLAERESRELLAAAARHDVGLDGRFSAGPAGIQVWDGPFSGPNGTHGSAVHLGSVDWSYDTPTKHYVTIYRAMVTQAGVDAGETTLSVLASVLALGGLPADGNRITLPVPPPRDPFRRLAATVS